MFAASDYRPDASTSTSTSNQSPFDQLLLPAPPASDSSAISSTKTGPEIDLLSGLDFSSPENGNSQALVPTSDPFSSSSPSDQNILALADVFPQNNTVSSNNNNNSNNNPALSLNSFDPNSSIPTSQGSQLQPQQQPMLYPNGNVTNSFASYDQGSQLNHANSAWNGGLNQGMNVNQQPPYYGMTFLLNFFIHINITEMCVQKHLFSSIPSYHLNFILYPLKMQF